MDFEKLEKDFAVKPYHERNKDLMRLSIGLKFVFQLVCVIAGLLFMKGIFYDLTKNELLSFLISFVCLVIIEATKQVLVTTTFKQKLVYSRVGALQVIFTLLLIGFSIFISKNGVESYYIIQNNTPQLVDVNFILQPYNDKLEAARQDKEKSFSLTWDGSKEQTRAGQQLTISSVDKILSLEKQIESIKLDVNSKNERIKEMSTFAALTVAIRLSWFVVIVDICLIVCTLYPLFYRFKSLKEWQLSKMPKEGQNKGIAEKNGKKKQKEAPLPYERGGNDSYFVGISKEDENLQSNDILENFDQQKTVIENTKKQQNKELTIVEKLKVDKNKSMRCLSAFRSKGVDIEKSESAQRHVKIINEINVQLQELKI